mgnify:CR=1 FL=1
MFFLSFPPEPRLFLQPIVQLVDLTENILKIGLDCLIKFFPLSVSESLEGKGSIWEVVLPIFC